MPTTESSEVERPPASPPGAQRWRVLKFGGTSVASVDRWQQIEHIARARVEEEGLSIVIVCSALAGVTDLLTRAMEARRANRSPATDVQEIHDRHARLANELGVSLEEVAAELELLSALMDRDDVDARWEAQVLALGELMSTRLGAAWLSARGLDCAWLDARELLTSESELPKRPERYLSAWCACAPDDATRERVAKTGARVVLTQGFIARSDEGETVLLGRGGSDTSAAYLACLLAAERLEIWTDVPGLFTANPRRIPEARLLQRVGYREAQALGALGASVLHPRAIEAVWEYGIPVEIGWTQRPEVAGTCINAARSHAGAKAITSRRQLAMFALRRPPSWQPVGFLADVSACFAGRGLSMDLVSSSCSEIRVTVDLDAFPSAEDEIAAILGELEAICHPRVVNPVASVSIVGDRVGQDLLGSRDAFGVFADEALFMLVHAADEHHVSFVLDPQSADRLVQAAHDHLVADQERHDLGGTWTELARAASRTGAAA